MADVPGKVLIYSPLIRLALYGVAMPHAAAVKMATIFPLKMTALHSVSRGELA